MRAAGGGGAVAVGAMGWGGAWAGAAHAEGSEVLMGPFTAATLAMDARPMLGLAAAVNLEGAGLIGGGVDGFSVGCPVRAGFMDLRLAAGLGFPSAFQIGLIGGIFYLGAEAPPATEERPHPESISEGGLEWGTFFTLGDMGSAEDLDLGGPSQITGEYVHQGAYDEFALIVGLGPFGGRFSYRWGEDLDMWTLGFYFNAFMYMMSDD